MSGVLLPPFHFLLVIKINDLTSLTPMHALKDHTIPFLIMITLVATIVAHLSMIDLGVPCTIGKGQNRKNSLLKSYLAMCMMIT